MKINNQNNRFLQYSAESVTDDELVTLVELALSALKVRHKPGDVLKSPEFAKKYIQLRLSSYKKEVFGVIWLDIRHRIISMEDLSFGSIDTAAVYPRVVAQRALEINACCAMFYHNHPSSGEPKPSKQDKHLTKILINSLGLFDIKVLDHFVVGVEGTLSFAQEGLLDTEVLL